MSWAQEFPRKDPVMLIIHLAHPVKDEGARKAIGDAVRHYFAYRKRLNRRELKRLWRDGRESLLIGLSFLAACTLTAGLLPSNTETWWNVVREGLTIAGWVALWRPMQIYLYDWWPLRRRGQIFEKMSRMQVQISAWKPGIQPSRKSVSGGETANSFEEHP